MNELDPSEETEENNREGTYKLIGCVAMVASALVVLALIALIGWGVLLVLP